MSRRPGPAMARVFLQHARWLEDQGPSYKHQAASCKRQASSNKQQAAGSPAGLNSDTIKIYK